MNYFIVNAFTDSLDAGNPAVVSNSNEYDFVSRFFAPNAGIPEDPVTGSAHCCLGPYWSTRLYTKLTGYQASERGGFVHIEQTKKRVLLGGKAVTFSSGKLMD